MRRSILVPITAAALVAMSNTPAPRAAEDSATTAASAPHDSTTDAGGATVTPARKPKAKAKTAEPGPGPAIGKAAEETGHALDRGTKDFRDGAENFFKDVGRFFSGGK